MLWGFCVLIFGGFGVELLFPFEPVKLSVPFFFSWWCLLTVAHELAHALMAKWVGWTVEHVELGFGRTIWRTRLAGATVAVKDQGNCSSCWAHATTAVVEGRLKLDTGNITSLSEQYLLDCDKSRVCSGCCGGLSEDSMQWLAGESGAATGEGPGISSEEAYPYTSASGTDPTESKWLRRKERNVVEFQSTPSCSTHSPH